MIFFQILPLNYLELLLCRTLPAVMVSATERKMMARAERVVQDVPSGPPGSTGVVKSQVVCLFVSFLPGVGIDVPTIGDLFHITSHQISVGYKKSPF